MSTVLLFGDVDAWGEVFVVFWRIVNSIIFALMWQNLIILEKYGANFVKVFDAWIIVVVAPWCIKSFFLPKFISQILIFLE